MPRKKKITEPIVVEVDSNIEEEITPVFKRKSDKSKIYYFSVIGHLNKDGEPIKYSFPSMYNDFNCQWDLMGIIDRSALKFYLDNPEYRSLEKWPLTFKYYINPREASVYETQIELAYAPVFSKTQE